MSEINIESFGALKDRAKSYHQEIQAAIDSASAGDTIIIPLCNEGEYYRVTQPPYWKSDINLKGFGKNSIIYNDRPVSVQAGDQLPMFWGNMQPSAYDPTQLIYFEADSAQYNKVKLHNSADLVRFTPGQIIFIRSIDGFQGQGGYKPYTMIANIVDSVISPNIIRTVHPVGASLTPAKIAISGNFYEGAGKRNDAFGHDSYFIKNVRIEDVCFKSKGQWMLFTSMIDAVWNNIYTEAEEAFGGNMMRNWVVSNVYSTWYKQAIEVSIGSYNTLIDNLQATWIDTGFVGDGTQPVIAVHENSKNVAIENCIILAGGFIGRGAKFSASVGCSIKNLTLDAPNVIGAGVEFSTSDTFSIVEKNTVSRSTLRLGKADRYILVDNKGGSLDANAVKNSNFFGPVKNNIKDTGTNTVLLNNYLEFTQS